MLGPVRRYLQALPGAAHDSARVSQLETENAQAVEASSRPTRRQRGDERRNSRKLRLAAGTAGMTIVPGPGDRVRARARDSTGPRRSTSARRSGVAVDQTVTSAAGLVGRVLRADASTSVVLLAADPGSGVGVRDVRSGELALATGAGTDGFTLTPLDPSADLKRRRPARDRPGRLVHLRGRPVRRHGHGACTSAPTGTVTATARSAITPTAIDLVGVVVRDAGDDTRAGSSRPPRRGPHGVLVVQATVLSPLTAPLAVSLPAVLVAAVGIEAGPSAGMSIGFSAGLLADLGLAASGRRARARLAAAGHRLRAARRSRAAARSVDRRRRRSAAGVTGLVTGVALALLDAPSSPLGPVAALALPSALGDLVLAVLVVPPVRVLAPLVGGAGHARSGRSPRRGRRWVTAAPAGSRSSACSWHRCSSR